MTEMAEVKFQLYSLRARGFPPNDQITLASNNLQVGVMTKTLDIYTLHISTCSQHTFFTFILANFYDEHSQINF